MSDSRDDASRYLRTELLERIAHELRGPAGVTLGALDELEHALEPLAVEQNRLLFAMARRGARRVLRTAERLTRTAQLEGNTAHVSCVTSELSAIVRQATQEAELIEARSTIRVTLDVPEAAVEADVDAGWLTVALTELISQAIRTARKAVEVSLQREGGLLVVRVADDRSVITESPSTRFVHLADRRDAALGWPLICDVARAHGADLRSEPREDASGVSCGLAVSLRLRAH
jgi:signal transduction histidine kinase